MKDKKNKAKFNIFQKSNEISSKTKKSNIRVGYIDKKLGYVNNVSIKEAKRVAKDDPGKTFILENRDGVRYLNINEVIDLKLKDVKPKKGATSKDCNPVEGLKEKNKDYSKKSPRIEFFGGGGVGIKPILSLMRVDKNYLPLTLSRVDLDFSTHLLQSLLMIADSLLREY